MKRTKIDANQFELEDTVVAIKRVSKTVKGGRTMRFSALVVVGDKNGHVGAGMGKAAEVPEAIRKGKEAAARNLMEVPFDENNSIPHDFLGKFGSANVLLKKAPEGNRVLSLVVRLVPYWIWLVTRTSVQNPLVPTTRQT